jgi:hypothetical protein
MISDWIRTTRKSRSKILTEGIERRKAWAGKILPTQAFLEQAKTRINL